MKIWKLSAEVDKYENLCPVKAFTWEELQAFDGRPLKSKWQPLPVEPMGKKKNPKWSDYPGFTIPVLSMKALNILRPLIRNSSEELELKFNEKEYMAINITAVLDVIDYEKAEYEKYSDGQRIMYFIKYAFRECDELNQHHIFKIIDEPKRWPFVSDAFKQAVEENGLTGFEFELVWDSEEHPQSTQMQLTPQDNVAGKTNEITDLYDAAGMSEGEELTYVGELDDEVLAEIDRVARIARRLFWIRRSAEGGDLAKEVYKVAEKVIGTGRFPRGYADTEDVAVALGCLFGEALVSGYGWKWKAVGRTEEEAAFSVMSPDGNWVNPCMLYLQRILKKENENTILLFYNMIEQTMKQTPERKPTMLM